ncbi:hypothetical protein BDB00DRAFT_790848 [Zychaea mexicana]|uniref:uncharacterized protein n=1 Tax=Zychaea mexicana TaxID=64656 RepID=UPI0022FEC946|nr:uncharacterized protein BDB00DRAFT_790848 [Zychaea mexicana]KAI9489793.1 hypothetical protein BDB00DRAFT_790848 [Zychaea mexicana]
MLPTPEDNIPTIMERVRKEYIQRTYDIKEWNDATDFLEKLARKTGKLQKKGEPDFHNTAMMVLNDWLRGRLPYYVPAPSFTKNGDDSYIPNQAKQGLIKPSTKNTSFALRLLCPPASFTPVHLQTYIKRSSVR